MEISYLGHSCFKVIGKNISVITDPFESSKVGFKPVKTSADVVTVSHDHYDHNNVSGITGEPMIFDSPGEYEIKDSSFEGVESKHGGGADVQNTIFVFEVDGVTFCHLGDLGHELDQNQLEKIDGVDILFIPVGGKFTIDAEEAAKVIAQVEPKIVIPMHYRTKDSKITEIDEIDKFLKTMGATDASPLPKLKVVKKDLPEEMKIIVLET